MEHWFGGISNFHVFVDGVFGGKTFGKLTDYCCVKWKLVGL